MAGRDCHGAGAEILFEANSLKLLIAAIVHGMTNQIVPMNMPITGAIGEPSPLGPSKPERDSMLSNTRTNVTYAQAAIRKKTDTDAKYAYRFQV